MVVGGGRTAAADRRSGNDVAKVQIPIGMHPDSLRGIFIFLTWCGVYSSADVWADKSVGGGLLGVVACKGS